MRQRCLADATSEGARNQPHRDHPARHRGTNVHRTGGAHRAVQAHGAETARPDSHRAPTVVVEERLLARTFNSESDPPLDLVDGPDPSAARSKSWRHIGTAGARGRDGCSWPGLLPVFGFGGAFVEKAVSHHPHP